MIATLSWSFTFAPLVGAIAVVISAALVARSVSRGLAVQRQLQSTQSFLELLAVAHGRPRDGREHVDVSEQVAAIHLVAEFGSEHLWLEAAAVAGLRSMTWISNETNPALGEAVAAGLAKIDGDDG